MLNTSYSKTIVVNTRLLIKDKLEGLGRFSMEMLIRLVKLKPDYHFIFLFDRPFDKSFVFGENVTPLVIGPQARHPFLFVIWFELSVKRILNKLKPDLFLSPDGYLPLTGNTKSIAVIHDLNFLHFPDKLPWLVRKYYNYFFPRFAKKATQIITVSQFSKQDIITSYGISNDKVDVVYNGVSSNFKPANEAEKKATKERFTDGNDFFLYVGSLHPRKNLIMLLKAFNSLNKNAQHNIKLVIAGERYWTDKETEAALKESQKNDSIVFTGRVNDNELTQLYASAVALSFVPLFEGFGFPVVEAMRSGTPVICSNNSALPEVAGDAAMLVDPNNEKDITRAMEDVLTDESLRQDLIQKGFIQAQKFNWDKSAQSLSSIIDKVLDA